MVLLVLRSFACLALGANAWPNLLECTEDSFNRLTAHSKVMGGKVKACEEGSCPASMTVASGAIKGTTEVQITTTAAGLFAIRVNEGAGSLSSTERLLEQTTDCPRQMVTHGLAPAPIKAGSYKVLFTPAEGKTLDDAVFSLGFAQGAALPGVADGVSVLTYPATPPAPAPAPKPVGTPEMRLLESPCESVDLDTSVEEGGAYALSISVRGEQGFEYDCTSSYETAQGVPDQDCIDWLPQTVLDQQEVLNITLQADRNGKQAVCMRWQLFFDGQSGGGASRPRGDTASRPVMPAMPVVSGDLGAEAQVGNTTRDQRIAAKHNYLDAMSYMSHRCVPKGEPKYTTDQLPGFIGKLVPSGASVFPPGIVRGERIRVAHALLASTGTIWSIDRRCSDAWYIDGAVQPVIGGKGWKESCVPSVPGVPHCHVNCEMTWRLAPGGVASWGLFSLSHHIPAPGIALVTQGELEEKEYNNTGCGGKAAFTV